MTDEGGRKRQESLRVFNQAASTYDRVGPRSFSYFGRRLVDLAGIHSGAKVLDVVILRGVLQCLSPEEARLAVKNTAAAINPGGILFIVAQILDDSRLSPPEALGYNLVFLNTFDAGESYTEQEHRAWLIEAGFVDIERAKFLLPDRHGLIKARKPR
jgi:hypothetical protein